MRILGPTRLSFGDTHSIIACGPLGIISANDRDAGDAPLSPGRANRNGASPSPANRGRGRGWGPGRPRPDRPAPGPPRRRPPRPGIIRRVGIFLHWQSSRPFRAQLPLEQKGQLTEVPSYSDLYSASRSLPLQGSLSGASCCTTGSFSRVRLFWQFPGVMVGRPLPCSLLAARPGQVGYGPQSAPDKDTGRRGSPLPSS